MSKWKTTNVQVGRSSSCCCFINYSVLMYRDERQLQDVKKKFLDLINALTDLKLVSAELFVLFMSSTCTAEFRPFFVVLNNDFLLDSVLLEVQIWESLFGVFSSSDCLNISSSQSKDVSSNCSSLENRLLLFNSFLN